MKVLQILLPLLALVSVACGRVLHHDGCVFDVNKHLSSIPPLLVDPQTGQFIRPFENDGIISFHKGRKVLLACPGNGNNFIRPKIKGEVVVSCIEGLDFNLHGESYNIKDFECRKWSSTVQQKIGKCHTNNSLVQIGFDVSTGFIPVIELCHDSKIHRTFYSKYLLTKEVADGYQRHVPRPTWLTGDLFGHLKPDSLYKRKSQEIVLGKLLGSTHLAKSFIQQKNDHFLAKGHMAPKADFFYGTEQMATFYYANAAPQWQTSNGHNWEAVENDVRHFASRLNEDLIVYTGTHGVDTLPNIHGEMVPLSLDGKGHLPVPRVYWKLLHNPSNDKGIVFVGYNSPYVTLEEIEDEMLCTDICDKVNWLSWHPHDILKGYSYCCEVNEFLSNVEEAPKINVKGILK